MNFLEPLIAELKQEAATTRRVLERVPPDQLSWKPHPKSMSLGQLAYHVATVPGLVGGMIAQDDFQIPSRFEQPPVQSTEGLLTALDETVRSATEMLGRLDEQRCAAVWRVMRGSDEIMALPRAVAIRALMFNHWYHHRGQLSVYLRELEVPVPSIYGPSADENPFG
ncbi:MAG TPA: DinB family protein [Terriglobia bacterium]|nr:DinB family protein [Terriglobia bacterium]